MKKLSSIIAGMVLLFLLVSCNEDYMETNLGNQPLTLSVTAEVLKLDITAPGSTAVEFEWTPGSNFNTNAAITYTFELGVSGSDFGKSIESTITQGKNTLAYTTSALNTLLLEEFGVAPGNEVELEARVIAKVHQEAIQPQISETVKVKVTSYQPVSSTLYLIGSAAPNGWSADNATKMNTVTGSAGGFVWQGKLNAGELKFITTLGEFLPSYGKGESETGLYLRESEEDPDVKFVIPATGIYKISVNLITLVIHIETLDAPEYSELWFVGDPTGWSFEPMIADESDPFIFHYRNELPGGGEFKIATAENWDAVFFRPVENNTTEGVDLDVAQWAGDPDYKWNVTEGAYKIKLDIRDMKIDIAPFTPYAMIYLVGDATPNGWDIGGATPMLTGDNAYQFTWTGTLNEGEMKFSCDKQDDWNGGWFLAGQDGMEPSGDTEQMIFSSPGSNPDNKWKITSSGIYTIVLDQLKETVRIVKQ